MSTWHGSSGSVPARIGDYTDIPSLWWVDPQKETDLRRAMGDDSVKLPVGETDVRYWPQYGEREKAAAKRAGAPE